MIILGGKFCIPSDEPRGKLNRLQVMLQAVIRRPQIESDQPPLLVLLHGYGSNEQDLIGLSDELDPRLCIVSLRAPLECDFGGFAWFEIAWGADGIQANGEQALASREILIEVLQMLPEALSIRPSKMLLGGFSQGAIMSLGVASARPDLLDGVIMLSGRLLPQFEQDARDEKFSKLPFLVQHGPADQVLSIEGAREVKRFLEVEGVSAEYFEYPMGHEISPASLEDLAGWIFEQIGTESR